MAKAIHTEGEVTFQAKGRVWEWNHPAGYSRRTDCPGGIENARKVAVIIGASFKRSAKAGRKDVSLDNLAKANIAQIFHNSDTPIQRYGRTLTQPPLPTN